MLYKPTFCCKCGEKIERTEWKIWTNRRFCELCETEYSFTDWALKIGLGFCVLFSIVVFLSYLVTSDRSDAADSVRTLKDSKPATLPSDQRSAKNNGQHADENSGNVGSTKPSLQGLVSNRSAPARDENREGNREVVPNQQNSGTLPVYVCGAETKKGLPCSRRVKGGGRCWQHVGQKAMLPESKLLISH